MNARRVNTVAGVILAAQKTHQTAAGIAMVLESAGLLQSPESAAEQAAVFATNEELLVRVERADLERLQVETENRRLARRLAALEAERAALLALHTPFPDSPHCVADGEQWPCPTRVALPAPAGALAEDRHLLDPLDVQLSHLADERPADDRRAASVAKLRGLLARQSGGAK